MPEGDIEEQLERVKAYLQPTRHSKSNPTDFPASSSTFQHTLPLKYIRAIHVPLSPSDNSSSSNEEEAMALQEQRTLKELAAPALDQQPLCIMYPALNTTFELKSGLIHLLPAFHGLPEKMQTNI